MDFSLTQGKTNLLEQRNKIQKQQQQQQQQQQIWKKTNDNIIEGYSGMIGTPTAVDDVNSQGLRNYNLKQSNLDRKLSEYATTHNSLMSRTREYIDSASETQSKNYNFMVGYQSYNDPQQPHTRVGCYNYQGSSGLTYQPDLGANATMQSCKIRATDLGKTVFAMRGSKQCYIGSDVNAAKRGGVGYTPVTAAVLVSSADTSINKAQFLNSGALGIFNSATVSNTTMPLYANGITGVPNCNDWAGGNIMIESATYGGNCASSASPGGQRISHVDGFTSLKEGLKCLEQPGGGLGWGTWLTAPECTASNDIKQQMIVYDDDATLGNLRLKHNYNPPSQESSLCVDVAGGWTWAGSPVIQWGCHTGNNQKWHYNATDKSLKPRHVSGQGMCLSGGNIDVNYRASIQPCNPSDPRQQWDVELAGILRTGNSPYSLVGTAVAANGGWTTIPNVANIDDGFGVITTDRSFMFNFFGTNYGGGLNGGIYWCTNNGIMFGRGTNQYTQWSPNTGPAILLGQHDRRTVTAQSNLYTTGDYTILSILVEFFNHYADRNSAGNGKYCIRLIKNNATAQQYIEVRVIQRCPTAGYPGNNGWNISNGTNFYPFVFGTTFIANGFPAANTSFIVAGNADGTDWYLRNPGYLNVY